MINSLTRTSAILIVLQLLYPNAENTCQAESGDVSLRIKRKRNNQRTGDDILVIRKCCPSHLYLDEWYNCVGSGDILITEFEKKLFEVGKKNESEYNIVETDYWKKCPTSLRREYEIVSFINNDKLYVVSDIELIDNDGFKEDFKSLVEKDYECVDFSYDLRSLVAVVCESEMQAVDPTSVIHKCCPSGEALSPDYSSCLRSNQVGIPPRQILDPDTEKMTVGYTVKYGVGNCGQDELMVTDNVQSVLTDGTFLPKSGENSHEHPSDGEPYHCVDVVSQNTPTEHQLKAIICLKRSCDKDFCVSKCCKKSEIFVHGGTFCAPVPESSYSWTANRFYTPELQLIPRERMNHVTVQYQHYFMDNYRKYKNILPNCDEVVILEKRHNDTFYLLQNGSLYHEEYGVTDDFCVDNTLNQFGQVVEIALKCVKGQEIVGIKHSEVFVDEPESLGQYFSVLRLCNTISGCISCVFLVITFLVYIFVPELNNLHGKIVISNVFSVFFLTAYLLLVYNFSHLLPRLACKIAGYCGYFFTISMFSWMTIMSFDLCWTFMRAKVPRRGSALVKFVIYSAAAWGSSAATTLWIILADLIMEDQNVNQRTFLTKPNVGELKCFLQDDAQGMFLHLPSMILMMVNVMFFFITITTLYRSNLNTQKARDSRQKSLKMLSAQNGTARTSRINKDAKEQFMLYTKLFIVMGIFWIFECIHHLVHGDHKNIRCVTSTELVFRIIGCINLLRGCLIFFIFVCKNSILDKIGKLTLFGVKLSFIRRKNISPFNSSVSKGTTIDDGSFIIRPDAEPSIPLVCVQENMIKIYRETKV